MRNSVNVFIPGKPVAWQRPNQSGKRRFDTPRNIAEKHRIRLQVKPALRQAGWSDPLPKGNPVHLMLAFFMPHVKTSKFTHHTVKPDLDNLIKIVKDALNKLAYEDDCQIMQVTALKRRSAAPGIMITLEELPIEH